MSDFSKNLRRIRKKAQLSQEQLAEKLSVTRQTVSSWERGNSYPDLDMLVKLSEILNTDPNELLYPQKSSVSKADKLNDKLYELLSPKALRIVALVILVLGLWTGFRTGAYVHSTNLLTVNVRVAFSEAIPIWAATIITAIIFFALSKILTLLIEIRDKE